MKLRNSRTKYLLVSPSSSNSESRHIFDVVYGLYKLEWMKINQSDIDLFIDGNNSKEISTIIADGSHNKYHIFNTSELFSIIQNLSNYENMVIFFTGHGDERGIVGQVEIKPEKLYEIIRNHSCLKNAVLVFGQCYAGIFNYTDARAKFTTNGNQVTPNLIILGATNLYESLSLPFTGKFLLNEKSWVANAFLAFIFDWFGNPIDIDGDGEYTITDAFKYAAMRANSGTKQAKADSFMNAFREYEKLKEIINQLKSNPDDQNLLLKKRTLEKFVTDELNLRFVHQESWLLNANQARILEF